MDGNFDLIKAIELSVDALSATYTLASSEYAIIDGKNCSNNFAPFQFKITTAIFFKVCLVICGFYYLKKQVILLERRSIRFRNPFYKSNDLVRWLPSDSLLSTLGCNALFGQKCLARF